MLKKIGPSLFCSLLIAGCAGDEKNLRLMDTVRNYDASIRWGQFAKAQMLQKDPQTELDFERLRDIKVTSVRPLQEIETEDGTQYLRTLEISYFHDPEYRLRSLIDKQIWEYDDERKTWRMDGEIPEFE